MHNKVMVLDVRFNRNGLNKIHFIAHYDNYTRRGVVVFNTITNRFCSHRGEIKLLNDICNDLLNYRQRGA